MKNIVIYQNLNKIEATKYAILAEEYLLSKGIKCYHNNIDFEELNSQIDCIVSFGGDGTILSAAHHFYKYEKPIMGFNVGKLGFLAEFSINNIKEELDNLLTGNYKIRKRFVLLAKYREQIAIALNDFVINRKASAKMINIKAFLEQQYIGDYRADGIIVATSTGSTAYSLACGGPIISPSSEAICITPIAAHSLTVRPLILPVDKEIKLQIDGGFDTANFVADGYSVTDISPNFTINITKSEKYVKIIVPANSNFFDVMRNKLNWTR